MVKLRTILQTVLVLHFCIGYLCVSVLAANDQEINGNIQAETIGDVQDVQGGESVETEGLESGYDSAYMTLDQIELETLRQKRDLLGQKLAMLEKIKADQISEEGYSDSSKSEETLTGLTRLVNATQESFFKQHDAE